METLLLKTAEFSQTGVKFDLEPRVSFGGRSARSPVGYDDQMSSDLAPTRDWDADVRVMISTKKWLERYGLKKNKLDMFHILPQIGFRVSEGQRKELICRLICVAACLDSGSNPLCSGFAPENDYLFDLIYLNFATLSSPRSHTSVTIAFVVQENSKK